MDVLVPHDLQYAACHMTTIKKPTLGTLSPRVGPSHIVSVGTVCHGQPISALSIRYTPRPGTHGQDDVVLRSIADNGGRHLLYIHIDVP